MKKTLLGYVAHQIKFFKDLHLAISLSLCLSFHLSYFVYLSNKGSDKIVWTGLSGPYLLDDALRTKIPCAGSYFIYNQALRL